MEGIAVKMKGVIITGPTGVIGTALIRKCIEKNIKILAIIRKNSFRKNQIPENPLVEVVECDLKDLRKLSKADIAQALKKKDTDIQYDVFYHLAWEATIGDERNDMKKQLFNVEYALDAVALAERLGCQTFIGAGSQAEYGRCELKLSDKTPTFPENGYGMAKLCAGQMTRAECEKRGIRHIWARILSVYGPADGEKTMIMSVIRKLLAGEKPLLTAGEQLWDYLYGGDAAEALYLLGEKGKHGNIYCIGSGQTRMLREYVEILRDTINPQLPLGIGELPYGEKQVMYLCADISKLTEDTGFVPKITFEEGIKETVKYVRDSENIKKETKNGTG